MAFCVVLAAAPLRAQEPDSADALETWITAVNQHAAGKTDPAVAYVGRLVYADRVTLNPAMQMLFAALRGDTVVTKTAGQRRVMALFRVVRGNPGPVTFLERAAVLHADAAMFRDRLPDVEDHAPPGERMPRPNIGMLGRPQRLGPRQTPDLLTNVEAALFTDGQVVGQRPLDWNWTFARNLVDLLARADPKSGSFKPSDIATAADVSFVAQWYHATAAYMLAMGKHGDLLRHLSHAASVLPEDARILFDRGCLAEAFGLPLYQVLPNDRQEIPGGGHRSLAVPSEDTVDAVAEHLFREAIASDPTYAEARVRLARLLERRRSYDEAAAQIDQALAVNPGKTVTYFAHIVGGRIELARGSAEAALGHYRAALATFPNAQSALLGASDAAAMSADIGGALTFVHALGDQTAHFRADPWWIYHLGAGRDVDDLMVALWARFAK